MPLTLVLGPANAAKAKVVFDRVRASVTNDPVLVVPTVGDVEHYQRELAGDGVVFGVEVQTFSRLIATIATAIGTGGRPLGRLARAQVVRATIAATPLAALERSAKTPGFAVAAGSLFAELQRCLVAPGRFEYALRAWAADRHSDVERRYADELAALYSGYRARCEQLGRPDSDGYTWKTIDSLRADPVAWGDRPVLFYGFDDLTPLERDVIETLARHAEVTVTLPYEPGRVAFVSRAATVEELRQIAGEVIILDASVDYHSHPALHQLERGLFEPGYRAIDPDGAVRLLEAGGERAEAELVAANVLRLIGDSVEPSEIAVLLRGDDATYALFEQVMTDYGIPVDHGRRVALGASRLGAGVLAGVRVALDPDAGTAELLTWLRTPGLLADPLLADALEAAVRRGELRCLADALRWCEERGASLRDGPDRTTLDRPTPEHARGEERGVSLGVGFGGPRVDDPPPTPERLHGLLDAIAARMHAVWTIPHRRRAALLDREQIIDAHVDADARSAIAELSELIDAGLITGTRELLDALASAPVRERSGGAGVLLADPHAIRARRFRAVFLCGLQDGAFPRHSEPDPFLSDQDRRAIALASGLRLPARENVLDRERYLFYAVASRPCDLLALSWCSSDEEGNQLVPSAFIEDVRALFDAQLWERRETRLLADVTWPARDAPTAHELARSLAALRSDPEPRPLPPPRSGAVLAALAARATEPARGLEAYAACGVRWLVEHLLRSERTDPEPDPQWRGNLAHKLLERTLTRMRDETGSAQITPERLDLARGALAAGVSRETTADGATALRRALIRGLAVDLERYLRVEAQTGAGFEPTEFEFSFGGASDIHGPLALGDAGAVTGRIDRIDFGPDGQAIVRDYKGRTVHGAQKWESEHALQLPLYLVAVRELLGRDPVAGLYQPLTGPKLAPRGLVRDDVPGTYTRTDIVDEHGFESTLAAACTTAERAAHALRGGKLEPCPEHCSPRGCRYPAICRAGEPKVELPA